MTKKISLLLLFIILLTFSNSSISTDTFKSLDNYYYILALGIDKANNDEITITIQILESSNNSNDSSKENPILYSMTGKTLSTCISTLETSLSKQINLSHCSSIIISEDIIKQKGLSNIVSTLGNSSEIRNTTYIFTCNDKASTFLKTISNTKENFTASIYEKFLHSSYDIGYTDICTFGKLFSSCKTPNSSILVPFINQSIDISNNIPTYQIDGGTILKNGEYVNTLSSYETLYINILTNTLKSSSINIQSPFNLNEHIDLEVHSYKKTKYKTYIINNSPFVEIDIYPEFVIKASGSTYNYLSNKNVELLEATLNDYLEKELNNTCNKITQEFNADLLSLKDKFKTNYLTYDDFNKLNFDLIFKNTFYKININSYIVSSNLFNKQ